MTYKLTPIESVKLSALIASAMNTAAARGHYIVRIDEVTERGRATMFCNTCGLEATADIRPTLNGIDVGGELVAMGCVK